MAFDAFISYSSKDKLTADAACATLEAAGIRCWIAPRDIRAGEEYGEAIINAIDRCRVMVLVFSSSSNDSRQIHREIERAVAKGVSIVPLRIEEIAPTKSMEYFLGGIHWLDALTPPLGEHLQHLAETIKALLQVGATARNGAPKGNGATAIAANAPPAAELSMPRDGGARSNDGAPVVASRKPALPMWSFAVLGVFCAALLAGGLWLYTKRGTAPVKAPTAERQADSLVPEDIPIISDRDRALVRAEYLPGPGHKALAIGNQIGFVTGQKDDDTAKTAALAACQKLAVRDARKCELYAVGNTVVFTGGHPPMPPEPWFVRNQTVERPFASDDVPLLSAVDRQQLQNTASWSKSWALAISSRSWSYFRAQDTQGEAVRRSLESCGNYSGISCLVVAMDGVFVVPIPTRMKAVRIFRAGTDTSIAPEMRDTVAKRLANATSGWNAVAVGAGGRPGLMLQAASEQAAVDGALADCGRQDSACRVIVIGPFVVEPL